MPRESASRQFSEAARARFDAIRDEPADFQKQNQALDQAVEAGLSALEISLIDSGWDSKEIKKQHAKETKPSPETRPDERRAVFEAGYDENAEVPPYVDQKNGAFFFALPGEKRSETLIANVLREQATRELKGRINAEKLGALPGWVRVKDNDYTGFTYRNTAVRTELVATLRYLDEIAKETAQSLEAVFPDVPEKDLHETPPQIAAGVVQNDIRPETFYAVPLEKNQRLPDTATMGISTWGQLWRRTEQLSWIQEHRPDAKTQQLIEASLGDLQKIRDQASALEASPLEKARLYDDQVDQYLVGLNLENTPEGDEVLSFLGERARWLIPSKELRGAEEVLDLAVKNWLQGEVDHDQKPDVDKYFGNLKKFQTYWPTISPETRVIIERSLEDLKNWGETAQKLLYLRGNFENTIAKNEIMVELYEEAGREIAALAGKKSDPEDLLRKIGELRTKDKYSELTPEYRLLLSEYLKKNLEKQLEENATELGTADRSSIREAMEGLREMDLDAAEAVAVDQAWNALRRAKPAALAEKIRELKTSKEFTVLSPGARVTIYDRLVRNGHIEPNSPEAKTLLSSKRLEVAARHGGKLRVRVIKKDGRAEELDLAPDPTLDEKGLTRAGADLDSGDLVIMSDVPASPWTKAGVERVESAAAKTTPKQIQKSLAERGLRSLVLKIE